MGDLDLVGAGEPDPEGADYTDASSVDRDRRLEDLDLDDDGDLAVRADLPPADPAHPAGGGELRGGPGDAELTGGRVPDRRGAVDRGARIATPPELGGCAGEVDGGDVLVSEPGRAEAAAAPEGSGGFTRQPAGGSG